MRAVALGLTRSGSVDGYVRVALARVEPDLTARTKIIARSGPLIVATLMVAPGIAASQRVLAPLARLHTEGLATALAPSAFRLIAVSGLRAKPCAAGVSARPPCQPVRPEGLSDDGHRLSRCSKPLRSAEAGREGRSRGAAQLTRSGTDLSKQQGAKTAAWYAPSMYNVVTQNRQNVHPVIKPDVDACRLDKGRSRACSAPVPRCGGAIADCPMIEIPGGHSRCQSDHPHPPAKVAVQRPSRSHPPFMQLCVAGGPDTLHRLRMSQLVRSLLVLVVLGGMLISTSFGQAAAQLAPVQAVMATPCCPDDCPPKPDCGPACAALMQCRFAPATMVLEIGLRQSADSYGAMKFAVSDVASDYSVVQTGLRRPPRL